MNLQNSQTNIQTVRQVCQESSSPSADMEPEALENLETLANAAFSNANENRKSNLLVLCSSSLQRE